MKQDAIMELLREAARLGRQTLDLPRPFIDPLTDDPHSLAGRRLNQIQVLLCRELSIREQRDTADTILSSVFVQTLEHNPDLLPNLFPLFAVLCGDRSRDVWIGEVDWSVADSR